MEAFATDYRLAQFSQAPDCSWKTSLQTSGVPGSSPGAGNWNTSGLLSKSGSKGQYDIINRLRNLLIDLLKEALSDMNIGRNQRAKRFLTMLSEIGNDEFHGK